MKVLKSGKFLTVIVAAALSAVSFSTFAECRYVGNPVRPYTIWIPAHCQNGCWKQGYYMKFVNPPVSSNNLYWVDGQYDRSGNWIPGHYQVRAYRVVGRY